MRTKLSAITTLFFFFIQLTASSTPPNWVPAPNLQFNMQVVAFLQLPDESYSTNENDLVAGFVGEQCRGLASPIASTDGRIFLTLASDVQSGETITFKAYLAETGQIADLAQTINFVDQGEIGDYLNPFIFTISHLYPPAVYTINALAGPNGSIDPSGEIEVVHGESAAFSFTANAGYEVYKVYVNGESVGQLDSYTFENVTTNQTIEVEFRLLAGLGENDANNNRLRIFPVPANEVIHIEFDGTFSGEALIFITDAKGQTIYREKTKHLPKSIDVSGFPAGHYVLHLSINTQKSISRKWLKIN